MKPIYLRIAEELGVREQQVAAAISLLDGGATVTFVARYRKEATGVALVPGQDAYVKIESLDSWSTLVGAGYAAARDTFYARLMLPQTARSEIVQSFFDGGS